MEYAVIAVAGWAGGGWAYPNPDDPDSPMCPVCRNVLGAIAAVILWMIYFKAAVGPDGGVVAMSVVGVLLGSFAVSLVGGVMGLAGRGKKAAG